MKEFEVTPENLGQFIIEVSEYIKEHGQVIVTSQQAGTGKWGMARLWRQWMGITSEWMVGQGAKMPLVIKKDGSWYGERPFSAADAHDLFTSQWLGLDADGTRLSWAKKAHDGMRPATKGERFSAMQRHEMWCAERGIKLPAPRNSEYRQIEAGK